jgi:cellobiose-specific phosphotransferase system component IIC
MQPYSQPGYAIQSFPPCRACGYVGPALIKSQITTGGWILAVVLFFTLCGTLFFWIPLVTMHDKFSSCAHCKVRL